LPEDAKPSLRPISPAPGSVLAPGVLQGTAFEVTLIVIAALFMAPASREITRPQWDLEWLVTLPLPLSTLLFSRVVERTATNSAGAAGSAALMLAEICATVAIGFALLHWQLRHGVVATGAREAVARRPRLARPAAADVRPSGAQLSAVQRRE